MIGTNRYLMIERANLFQSLSNSSKFRNSFYCKMLILQDNMLICILQDVNLMRI